ncbi:uncharacterized protein LOC143174533 isoform X2 [Nomia melanderi]|uniref:uncharacterized protein LOC143174533 isoform X2 n=1 Tax=Nomia melanderi TaxID=2448451 RepID=UPI003FCDBBB7
MNSRFLRSLLQNVSHTQYSNLKTSFPYEGRSVNKNLPTMDRRGRVRPPDISGIFMVTISRFVSPHERRKFSNRKLEMIGSILAWTRKSKQCICNTCRYAVTPVHLRRVNDQRQFS